MSLLTVLIVDDEPLARRGIRQLLEPHGEFTVVGEARNGKEAARAIRTLRPDFVFLDVQMPGQSGLDVVRDIGPSEMPAVIFVTAYDRFAVAAFEAHALDYLVKPVTQQRFRATVERVRARHREREAVAWAERFAGMLADADKAATAARLTVPTASGFVVLAVDEIEWIEADDYYAAIHARGRRLLIRESLASFEARLDQRAFLRVHRSAIVALGVVREFRTTPDGGTVLILRDGSRVPVSRRRKEDVLRALASAPPRQ